MKKEQSYEVDVWHADKHESLLQVDTMVGQAYPKFTGKFVTSETS